jgi:L-amino acid N-acyltransferase YncA
MEISFYDLKNSDFKSVKDIYNYYVLNTTVTFQIKPASTDDLKSSMFVDHPRYKSILIKCDNALCGFCFFTQYRKKEAYDNTAEVGIYLKPGYTGRGIGRRALDVIEQKARDCGIKVLLAFISGDNQESIIFFERLKYEKCAHFKNVGEKFGKRLDVVAYEKELTI